MKGHRCKSTLKTGKAHKEYAEEKENEGKGYFECFG